MNESQATRASLLMRIRDGQDVRAWSEFVEIYTPAVYGFVRRRGLQDSDAADVTQDVFRTVAGAIGRFDCDRSRGSFRGWLMTVTRSRLSDFLTARGRQQPGSGDTAVQQCLEQQPSPEDEDIWELEYRKSVFDWAAAQVRCEFRDSTWQAFHQMSIEGKNAKEVAESLGITAGAVYIAKCRVLARLKEKIQQSEE